MKKNKTLKVVLVLILIISFSVFAVKPVEAASKKVSKKTVTITLDKKHPIKYYILKTSSEKSVTDVSIVIQKMKGKPKAKKIEWLFYVNVPSDLWEGSLMMDVKSSKFKKGKSLPLSNTSLIGSVLLEYEMPEGVSSVTYKVTFKNSKNRKTIKAVTPIDSTDEWDKYRNSLGG